MHEHNADRRDADENSVRITKPISSLIWGVQLSVVRKKLNVVADGVGES